MTLIKPVSRQEVPHGVSEVAPALAKRLEKSAAAAESPPESHQERLFSLDFLRGADIFLLTVLSVIVCKLPEVCPLPKGFLAQFTHPAWVGFTLYDMIMPLFIFMCGAALPLALPRRLDAYGKARSAYWGHVLSRFLLLWILGMIAQGELFTFDLKRISFFNNTLQTIAVGYLVTAVVSLVPSRIFQIAVPFLLAAGYTAFLHLCGDFTPTGNAAVVYEVKLLSLVYPSSWHPVRQIVDWHYTWWTTVPMFGAMGLAGYHATKLLVAETWSKPKRAFVTASVGVSLVVLGLLLTTFDPCIKHIFTASFTAMAMGVSFVLYALSYWLFDICAWRFGTALITLFGRRSLCAYMLAETCFKPLLLVLPAAVLPGLRRFMSPGAYKLAFVLLECVSLVVFVWIWDCARRRRRPAESEDKS